MNLQAKAMSLSGLGIAYFVLGCLLPALVGEIYYLLWWKKKSRSHNTEIIEVHHHHHHNNNYYAKGFLSRIFWKAPCSSTPMNVTTKAESKSGSNEEEEEELSDLELGLTNLKNLKKKKESGEEDQESVESELMRLHNQRLLFTIKEETREELLESEDYEKSKVEIKGSVINPLFEPSSAEFRSSSSSSSPPPKFKFLRDAEEKLYRRMIEEEEAKKNKDLNNRYDSVRDYRDGSFLRLIKNKERIQFPSSSSSQVLPLASSPTTPQINVNL